MAISVVAPGSMVELRRVLVDHLAPGETRIRAVELVAADDHAEVRLGASVAGWVSASVDDGASYHPLGPDVRTGMEAGPMERGSRRRVLLRVAAPEAFRQRRVALLVGEGI